MPSVASKRGVAALEASPSLFARAWKWGAGSLSAGAALVSILSSVRSITGAEQVRWIGVAPAADTAWSLGDTLQLATTLTDAHGGVLPGVRVGWTSTDTSVAIVDSGGAVVARAPGAATVVAAAGGHIAQSRIVVRPRPAAIRVFGDASTCRHGTWSGWEPSGSRSSTVASHCSVRVPVTSAVTCSTSTSTSPARCPVPPSSCGPCEDHPHDGHHEQRDEDQAEDQRGPRRTTRPGGVQERSRGTILRHRDRPTRPRPVGQGRLAEQHLRPAVVARVEVLVALRGLGERQLVGDDEGRLARPADQVAQLPVVVLDLACPVPISAP